MSSTATVPEEALAQACTKAAFKAWVEAHPDGAILGKARENHDCPVAHYLNETFFGLRANVAYMWVSWWEDDEESEEHFNRFSLNELPPVVSAIDELYQEPYDVTKEQVMEVLAHVENC